ncbi:hypothetical protein [Aquimarina agarilytica]|uniref:hypothetical protein n=1 Tax=Aquimarina agarilytica TaxID=1087449 RepID=UPI000289444B|nr:hypothetical protein [Aquimarina agarilytica]
MKKIVTTLFFLIYFINANSQQSIAPKDPALRYNLDKYGERPIKIKPQPFGRKRYGIFLYKQLKFEESTSSFIDEVIDAYKNQFPQVSTSFWNKVKQEIDYKRVEKHTIAALANNNSIKDRFEFVKKYNITNQNDVYYTKEFKRSNKSLNEELYKVGRKLGGYLNNKIMSLIISELK